MTKPHCHTNSQETRSTSVKRNSAALFGGILSRHYRIIYLIFTRSEEIDTKRINCCTTSRYLTYQRSCSQTGISGLRGIFLGSELLRRTSKSCASLIFFGKPSYNEMELALTSVKRPNRSLASWCKCAVRPLSSAPANCSFRRNAEFARLLFDVSKSKASFAAQKLSFALRSLEAIHVLKADS